MEEREITAHLTDAQIQTLTELAAKRGVDANTVLQQAIATEKLIADNVGANDTLQIKHGNSYVSEVIFGDGRDN